MFGKIKIDPNIKLRSFKIILQRLNYDDYRQQKTQKETNTEERSIVKNTRKTALSDEICKIILSSAETDEIVRKMRGENKWNIPNYCVFLIVIYIFHLLLLVSRPSASLVKKYALKSVHSMVVWLPKKAEFEIPPLKK